MLMTLMSGVGLLLWVGHAGSKAEGMRSSGTAPEIKAASAFFNGSATSLKWTCIFCVWEKTYLERAIRSIFNGALRPGS